MCASRAIELDRMTKLGNAPCDISESKKIRQGLSGQRCFFVSFCHQEISNCTHSSRNCCQVGYMVLNLFYKGSLVYCKENYYNVSRFKTGSNILQGRGLTFFRGLVGTQIAYSLLQ